MALLEIPGSDEPPSHDQAGDLPEPCDDPAPSFGTLEEGGIWACVGCGYKVQLIPSEGMWRGFFARMWKHSEPLIRLRPATAAGLVQAIPPLAPKQQHE